MYKRCLSLLYIQEMSFVECTRDVFRGEHWRLRGCRDGDRGGGMGDEHEIGAQGWETSMQARRGHAGVQEREARGPLHLYLLSHKPQDAHQP